MTSSSEAPAQPLESTWVRALVLFALLVAGVVLWLHFGQIEWAYRFQFWGLVVVAVLVLASPIAGWVGKGLDRIRHFSMPVRSAVAVGLLIASAGALLYLNFVREQADLYPAVCDEFSYTVQAQLLAHGRLWSPGHEHDDFFRSYQVVADPVYSSIYFPGTALWIAPWSMIDAAGGYAFLGPWLAASLAVMLVYLVTAELLDDLAGLLAAFLTFAVPIWRGLAMVIMGQCIAAMLGLLVIFLFLRWRSAARRGRTTSAALLGLAAGFFATWAMLTRPVDGLAYSLPVVIAVLATRGIPARLRALSVAAAVVGILPLAGLQLSFNKAVSGSLLKTPFSWYNDIYLPGTTYGADIRDHERMKQVPHTAHFHYSYQTFTRPFVEKLAGESWSAIAHERFRVTMVAGTTHGMTLIFIPFALLILLPRRGLTVVDEDKALELSRRVGGWDLWLLAAPFPLIFLLYLPYGFFLYQYAGASVPTIALWIVAGAWGLAAFVGTMTRQKAPPLNGGVLWMAAVAVAAVLIGLMSLYFGPFVLMTSQTLLIAPFAYFIAAAALSGRAEPGMAAGLRRSAWVFALAAPLVLGTRGIPGLFRTPSEDWYQIPELRTIDEILATIDVPAVVFVTPPSDDAPAEAEAVYNLGVASPDDARVVRAHDLGRRNVELLDYYAQRQPVRRVYHYDRHNRGLTDLGPVTELAGEPRERLLERFDELSLRWRARYAALLTEVGYDPPQMPFDVPPKSEWLWSDYATESAPAAESGSPSTRPSP